MKLYTERQVQLASFLGTPVAGGILMARNAERSGQEGGRKKYIAISVVATAGLLTLALILPKRPTGNFLLPLMAACAMQWWYQRARGGLIGKFPEVERESWWAVVGLSLLVAIALFILLILGVMGWIGVAHWIH